MCLFAVQVDVWSLGCVFFALCYGHTPFESPVEGFMKLLAISGEVLQIVHVQLGIGTGYFGRGGCADSACRAPHHDSE